MKVRKGNEKMLYCSIGDFLKQVRKYNKMTLKEVAQSCHTGEGALSKFENSKRIPSLNTLRNLLNFYEIKYEINGYKDLTTFFSCYKKSSFTPLDIFPFIISLTENKVYFFDDREEKDDSLKIHKQCSLNELENAIKYVYSLVALNHTLNESEYDEIAKNIKLLNNQGLKKVIDYIKDLIENPKYKA